MTHIRIFQLKNLPFMEELERDALYFKHGTIIRTGITCKKIPL